MIIIESKRKKPSTILKQYPDAIMADVTSSAKDGPLGHRKGVHGTELLGYIEDRKIMLPRDLVIWE